MSGNIFRAPFFFPTNTPETPRKLALISPYFAVLYGGSVVYRLARKSGLKRLIRAILLYVKMFRK